MKYSYKPTGVCARAFDIEIENNKIKELSIHGGCQGNTRGIEILCKGRDVKELITLLEGIQCGIKGTSCPDQLAKALKEAMSS